MTKGEKVRIEARLRRFDRNADLLWQLLHDPAWVAEHLAEVLRSQRLLNDEPAS